MIDSTVMFSFSTICFDIKMSANITLFSGNIDPSAKSMSLNGISKIVPEGHLQAVSCATDDNDIQPMDIFMRFDNKPLIGTSIRRDDGPLLISKQTLIR